MKKLRVDDRAQIKQLLYGKSVLGVKDDQYRSFNGFQLWWYDKNLDICYCCESHWTDIRKRVKQYSLDNAAKILWRRRGSLFIRSRSLGQVRTTAGFQPAGGDRVRYRRKSQWLQSLAAGPVTW